MQSTRTVRPVFPYRSAALLTAWLLWLWLVGGASRPAELGQVLTRAAAWVIVILMILWSGRLDWRRELPVVLLIGAAVALAALQLLPLPPAIWTALPGRDLLAETATAMNGSQPWRPLSVVPDATVNALSSLIVPVATLALLSGLSPPQRWRTASLLLGIIVASCGLGLLQFSGAGFDNPFINGISGMVSGSFANRNHLALFAAIGCIIAPVWAFRGGTGARWRFLASILLVVLFGLITLATGSRAGLLLAVLGVLIGLLAVRREVVRELSRMPRSAAFAAIIGTVGFVAAVLVLSVVFGRAVSLDRVLTLDVAGDLRSRAFPVVLELVARYFPVGAGMGTFDPVFRIVEPFAFLHRGYFNHAHSDVLEVLIEGGIPALLILATALLWWLWASIHAWRDAPSGVDGALPRMGSGILLLVLVASLSDYPARTPMMMAVVVIAAVWLADRAGGEALRARTA